MTRQTIYNFEAEKNDGENHNLSAEQQKVVLIVNTASKCGFTLQYAGLEKLYGEFREQALEILAFPSNQFMKQEPLSDEEIADFCQLNYGVSFPVPGILRSQNIKWNST